MEKQVLEQNDSIGIIDYCMLGAMLTVSIAIGVWTGYKGGGKDAKQFLQGGRTMSPYPTALSLTGGVISAIAILGGLFHIKSQVVL